MGENQALARRLGTGDAVVIGLGSMIGAGIFVVLGPAARVAGAGLVIGLAVAALVAYCNATSSARLAARYPTSGGAYLYGRKRLGDFWGYLAGWAFVAGKTASCAAMALTVGVYLWPAHSHAVAVAAVLALTALSYTGVQRSARLTRVIVAVVVVVLAAVVVTSLRAEPATVPPIDLTDVTVDGVLQSAGLLFFAFAGYARIATLGEEVRAPARVIPRAIPLALGIALAVYAVVAVAVLAVLGAPRLANAVSPLSEAVQAAGANWLVPVVQAAAAVAALGSLLGLLLGVSRTTLAMARDRHLPHVLAAVHPRFQVPHRAELLIGVVVAALAATADLRNTIGFSSFGVLIYYAVANASALTLRPDEGRPAPLLPILGVLGCGTLAFALPSASVVSGAAVIGGGAAVYALRRARSAWHRRRATPTR